MAGADSAGAPATGGDETTRGDERPPRGIRVFVWIFLAAFMICGAAGIEAWPLTGFRLFSHLRTSARPGPGSLRTPPLFPTANGQTLDTAPD